MKKTKLKLKALQKTTTIFAKMITYLLFHLWDQEDQRCPSLLAFPEDLEDPRHLKHRWDQGYPSVTSIKVNTSWPKLLQTCELYIDYGV